MIDRFMRVAALAAFAVATALAPASAGEAPMLSEMVAAGKLPPLEERLPAEPLVVDFDAEGKSIGKYGGQIRMLMASPKDIGQITVYEYARLVGYNPSIELYPDILAEAKDEGERVFTLRIRKGHKWSDGHPFTAEDFRYFWEDMTLDPELGREGIPSEMLVDGEQPKFEVVDELTVRCELLPGVPGPPVTGGTPDGVGFDDSPGPRGPVFTKLKLLDFVPPVYPPRCLRLGIEGRVIVRVLVGEDGRPQEVTVGTSSGDATLDESAMKAVRRWRFEAATRNGAPVRAWVNAPVEFKLID